MERWPYLLGLAVTLRFVRESRRRPLHSTPEIGDPSEWGKPSASCAYVASMWIHFAEEARDFHKYFLELPI